MNPINSAQPNPADINRLLEPFGLTGDQFEAARERQRDVSVTAGAGSGKTRTLVARYLPLLVESGSPRRVVAITFTEKAAREMRNRIRREIRARIDPADPSGQALWSGLEAQMDAARIGTIHALCSEIVRAHPVEANLDPQVGLLEEGQMAVLRAQAAADALAWAVGQAELAPLFGVFRAASLHANLVDLLERRLDAADWLAGGSTPQAVVRTALRGWLAEETIAAALADLRDLRDAHTLTADAGEKLAAMVEDLLDRLDTARTALERGEVTAAGQALFAARREAMRGNVGSKTSRAKEAVRAIKDCYDAGLAWLGGTQSKDPPPDPALEDCLADALPRFTALYRQALANYQAALRQRNAIDFDTLEGTALDLLRRPEIATRWQAEIDAVLVDEFQDTNARQRDIVRALCGDRPGRLFIVGDDRQSIYRFRGADVTVFRGLQAQIRAAGGLPIDLKLTFRTHQPLLAGLDALLAPLMGEPGQASPPYYVPFAPLVAHRSQPPAQMAAPYIEFVLATGEDSAAGREAAARALARRLLELKAAGQIRAWDEVALLFRASSGFPVYEDAFEGGGIPYVTTAGRGFYQRPEVRDALNLLRALADPWDDLALTGLLRSPSFGVSLEGLHRLRWPGGAPSALYPALQGDLAGLDAADRAAALHARDFLTELCPWVDRVPVDELLARALAFTDYRAILTGGHTAGSGRSWRNLDKLLEDARASQAVQVSAFLEYLQTLQDVGAREGEAPADAAGAVRLMTIHKSKGLEFPVVVLADAARQAPSTHAGLYLLPETGLVLRPDRLEGQPLAYRYAHAIDQDQTNAESLRLLYVALTRAQDKLIVSGHFGLRGEKPDPRGWLGKLVGAAGVDLAALLDQPGAWAPVDLAGGARLGVWLEPAGAALGVLPPVAPPAWPESTAAPLFHPLPLPDGPAADLPEEEEALPAWRVTGLDDQRFGVALGRLVHRAVQGWVFPGDARLDGILRTAGMESGLLDAGELDRALRIAAELLERFHRSPLWAEIDAADDRRHEIPYARQTVAGKVDNGRLDLLYRVGEGWRLVDVKTDTLRSDADREACVHRYTRQMQRYRSAVAALLGPPERVCLAFLDDRGRVSVVEV